MTVFGIGGCMGLMLVGYGIKDSCYEIAELQFRDIQMYDGSVYLKEDISDETRQNLLDYMKDDSDISHYMQTSMKNVTLVNGKNKRDTYQVVFSEPKNVKDYFDFHDRKSKEEYTLDDEGVIISEKTGKLLNAKAGDTIEIKDEENGNKKVKLLIFARTIWDTIFSSLLLIMKKCMVRIRNITVFSLQDKKEIRRKTITRLVKTF